MGMAVRAYIRVLGIGMGFAVRMVVERTFEFGCVRLGRVGCTAESESVRG